MTLSPIRTERLIIRCYKLSDAPLLKEAIDTSIEHLKPWLERASQEPESIKKKEERLLLYQKKFQANEERNYGLFEKDEEKQVGAVGLHPRIGPGGVEIGYWVRESHQGKGFITEAVNALVPVAFDELGFKYIEIHTRLDNVRSVRIPEKLGFKRGGIITRRTGDRQVRIMEKKIKKLLRK